MYSLDPVTHADWPRGFFLSCLFADVYIHLAPFMNILSLRNGMLIALV